MQISYSTTGQLSNIYDSANAWEERLSQHWLEQSITCSYRVCWWGWWSGAGVINWLGRRKSGLGWAEEGGNCISWWIGVQGRMSVSWVSGCGFQTEKVGNRGFLGGCSMYGAAQFISSRRLIKWSIMWGGQCLADLFSLLCWFDVLLKRLSLKIVMATS